MTVSAELDTHVENVSGLSLAKLYEDAGGGEESDISFNAGI